MPYFNKIFGNDSEVRPRYAGVLDHWKSLPSKKRWAYLSTVERRNFGKNWFDAP